MRKLLILLGFMGCLFCNSAHAGQMVNVEYIHLLIEQKWGLSIPYNPNVTNPKVAANMEYLLGMVDIANKRLNGDATTDYLHSEYATKYAADTVAANDAVRRLIKYDPKFTVITTSDTQSFSFQMSAMGDFKVDWGDGHIETIKRSDTDQGIYSHTYKTAGKYIIGFGGNATGYSTDNNTAAISFADNGSVAGISGSLGAIFSTIGDGSGKGHQPRFNNTFYNCIQLTGDIPENLFAGVTGAPVSYMFSGTFEGCSNLSGPIPENLFAGISGAPAEGMFEYTFSFCNGLTSIPGNLFAGISGAPAENMFSNTFDGCSGLRNIPAGLFAGISGAPAEYMFYETFNSCDNLSGSIPENLFGEFSGAPARYMFHQTFSGCSNLSGSIPESLFAGISGPPAEYMFERTFYGCSGLTGPIPENLFAGISGAPAEYMFYETFNSCSNLSGSIPGNLFAGISGAPARSMFFGTFEGCSNLSGTIPENLFAGISGAPEQHMFGYTFYGCTGLSGPIPETLFGDISGMAQYGMFTYMFAGCTSLMGPSAKINGEYLYEIWPFATAYQVGGCYSGDTGLDDYADIPATWK